MNTTPQTDRPTAIFTIAHNRIERDIDAQFENYCKRVAENEEDYMSEE